MSVKQSDCMYLKLTMGTCARSKRQSYKTPEKDMKDTTHIDEASWQAAGEQSAT